MTILALNTRGGLLLASLKEPTRPTRDRKDDVQRAHEKHKPNWLPDTRTVFPVPPTIRIVASQDGAAPRDIEKGICCNRNVVGHTIRDRRVICFALLLFERPHFIAAWPLKACTNRNEGTGFV